MPCFLRSKARTVRDLRDWQGVTARLSIYFGLEIQRDLLARRYGRQREVLQALRTLQRYFREQDDKKCEHIKKY